ncbi:MAG: diguanylate cyclase [Desulfocapsa sp.]|nr:diguanylate cyclase [Desulfocapsa sp.]
MIISGVMKKPHFVTTFLVTALVISTLILGGTFIWFYLRTEKLSLKLIHQQAQSLFQQVVLTRRWVTQHGGVFVKVQPGVNPNPFLTKLPGLKVNIKDQDGVKYTLRNPGLVTREISQLANQSGLFTARITSLKPVNMLTNSPDEFEREALKLLEEGRNEVAKIQKTSQGTIYRYIAPLYYEQTCNRCHSQQGYEDGDIRGGISISIPMDKLVLEMQQTRLYTIIAVIGIFITLALILLIITRRFLKELNIAHEELVNLASVDSLTGLNNRKSAMIRFEEEISSQTRFKDSLSCLMLDIDHFKTVNDRYGHQVGDEALVKVAKTLFEMTRSYDIVCRYGGEEFMIIMPRTALKNAKIVAERILKKIADDSIEVPNGQFSLTISCGLAQLNDNEIADKVIGRADAALYQAKNEGRNRICIADD